MPQQVASDNSSQSNPNWGSTLMELGNSTEAIEYFELAAYLSPDLAIVQHNWGYSLAVLGRPAEAIEQGRHAVRLLPGDVQANRLVASLLASYEASEGGDPAQAVQLALHACRLTNHRDAACLNTLAAAYAAAGRFDQAVATAKEAWQLAKAVGQNSLAEEIHVRLQPYRDRKPYRDAVGSAVKGRA